MTHWVIDLDSERKARLPHDALEVGDLVRCADGGERLLFRDRFVALRVAFRMGHPAVSPKAEEARPR